MHFIPIAVSLLAAIAEAAPQLGDAAAIVPAVPGNIAAGLASSTRKSPAKGPIRATAEENAAKGTLPGSSADGMKGVVVEDDLLKAQTPGSKLVTKLHGPFHMRAGSMYDGAAGGAPPCQNCFITAIQAGLVDMQGNRVNINKGAWLHHMVLAELGGGTDPVCKLPGGGAVTQTTSGVFRRIFASGNERGLIRVNKGGSKTGIKIGNEKSMFGMVVELMNMAAQPQSVRMSMTYEYVPAAQAQGYREVLPVWMDITGCGVSSAPAKKGVYQYTSPEWTSNVNGEFKQAAGHVHDGGTDIQIFKNGKPVCVSKMLYGHRRTGYGPMPMGEMSKNMDMQENQPNVHISDAGICYNFGTIKVGDKMQLTAYYDGTLHPQMKRKGGLDPIMGISIVYVALNH